MVVNEGGARNFFQAEQREFDHSQKPETPRSGGERHWVLRNQVRPT